MHPLHFFPNARKVNTYFNIFLCSPDLEKRRTLLAWRATQQGCSRQPPLRCTEAGRGTGEPLPSQKCPAPLPRHNSAIRMLLRSRNRSYIFFTTALYNVLQASWALCKPYSSWAWCLSPYHMGFICLTLSQMQLCQTNVS